MPLLQQPGHYVVGFYFNKVKTLVALIRKAHPPEQLGLLNGPGGRIQNGESPLECMVREFEEEVGKKTVKEDWQQFAVLQFEKDQSTSTIHFFRASGSLNGLVTKTDEKLVLTPISVLSTQLTVCNVRWLIQMALDENNSVEHIITEQTIQLGVASGS